MCSTDNINNNSRLPRPKSGAMLAARRNTKKQPTQPTPVQARRASSKTDARKGAASAKMQGTNAVASSDGQLRPAIPVSSTSSPSDGLSPHRGGGKGGEGHQGVSGSILHRMLCIMQGMEADIVCLKTDIVSLKKSNKQQAKELAELRAKNIRLERDNDAFRVEVESTLEVFEDFITRNFKQGQELDARMEGYMDVVGDEFNRLDLQTDALISTVESVRDVASAAAQGVKQVERHQAITADDEKMSKEHGQEAEVFETPVSERKCPLLPASSLALNMTTRSEATTTASIKVVDRLNIAGRDDEGEDGTGTATPSPTTSSSTSGTFMATLGDNGSQINKVGNGDGDGEDGGWMCNTDPAANLPGAPNVSVGQDGRTQQHHE